jgi:alkylation response protein AidB-like acyl-CoA dehydrogenase
VDFADSPAEADFRARLRAWLVDNDPKLPASSTDDRYWAGQAAWHQALYDGGFFGLSWPKAIGGHELPSVYDVILDEELAAAGTPPRPSLGYLVQGILHHGSAAIQQRFLPGIVNGRDRWCQGFSEPDAGSDLASLRTRADRDGDEFVLTGHKVWTSYSDDADWCLVLARTDHDVAKHKGISAFAVPMRQPGIEQRPLKMINGITKEFGEVLLDGVSHGPEGSVDKLLMTWTEQTVGHAALAIGGDAGLKTYLYSRAQSVMGGTSQIQRNLIARRILGLPS